jgi:glycyl-tRNA synthetase beta chain
LDASVIVRPSRRRELIETEACHLAEEIGGRIHEDSDLLEELVYLAEHPRGVRGDFDPAMAEVLPREVIITAMRAHQRYFSVESGEGTLIPCFLTFRDGGDEGIENVKEGNERVLRARLEDAVFYWNEDRATSSEEKLRRLGSVVWIEGFGSVGDKCRRVAELACELAEALMPELPHEKVHRAGLLSKSDLATEMIKDGKEFTKLQGIMGRYYALAAGEDAEVADAIAEHLYPRFAEDRLPEGELGRVLALADRLDTLAGCVLAGFIPTGSADPYALRRQALAVLRILSQNELRCDLTKWIDKSLHNYSQPPSALKEAASVITGLFWGRLETLLQDLPVEIVQSVLSVFPLDPVENARASEDLAHLRGSETFQMLIEGARRCRNILVKADRLPEESLAPQERAQALQRESRARWERGDLKGYRADEQADEAERELIEAAQQILPQLESGLSESSYTRVYEALATLGKPIDRYFVEVLVNAPDPVLRARRLDWLESLHYLFARFADLSRLSAS